MRPRLSERLEAGRVRDGMMASKPEWGAYGAFVLMGPCGRKLVIQASGADAKDHVAQGWEHVSVSTERRPPNWEEMCWVKDQFWGAEECVVQYHPPASRYVNDHPNVLHLWRHKVCEFPMPPVLLV